MEIRSGVVSPASLGSRSGVLSPTPSGDDFYQVARFFGDLAHKKAVVGHFQQLGTVVVSYFSGLHRGWYVKVHCPGLVPEGVTSIEKLAEIFEFHFQTDISFVFGYNKWLPERLEMAPTGQSSASGCLLNWLSRASVAKLPHDELVEAMSAFDICGYERGGNGFTSGDSTPWFLSARTRLDGKGCVGVRFPPRRSIFDNDPPGSNNDRWPVDGLWHPDNNSSFLGFRVHLWIVGRQASFDDPLFSGSYYSTVVPRSRAALELFVDFLGEPGQMNYFILRRDVIWAAGRWDPPPDYPHNEPNSHVEL